jgi:hypothetical protein
VSCGEFWYCRTAKGSAGSGRELSASLEALDPQMREADVVLTPDPALIEPQPGVDRVWGREVVFKHVPLVRQDLAGLPPEATPTGGAGK